MFFKKLILVNFIFISSVWAAVGDHESEERKNEPEEGEEKFYGSDLQPYEFELYTYAILLGLQDLRDLLENQLHNQTSTLNAKLGGMGILLDDCRQCQSDLEIFEKIRAYLNDNITIENLNTITEEQLKTLINRLNDFTEELNQHIEIILNTLHIFGYEHPTMIQTLRHIIEESGLTAFWRVDNDGAMIYEAQANEAPLTEDETYLHMQLVLVQRASNGLYEWMLEYNATTDAVEAPAETPLTNDSSPAPESTPTEPAHLENQTTELTQEDLTLTLTPQQLEAQRRHLLNRILQDYTNREDCRAAARRGSDFGFL